VSARAVLPLAVLLAACGGQEPQATWVRAAGADDTQCAVKAGERLVMARRDGALFCLRYRPGPSARDGEVGVTVVAESRPGEAKARP